MRWVEHVACMIEIKQILVAKPEEKRPLERPGHRWEESNKINLNEIEWEGEDWVHASQDTDQWQALVNMVVNLSVSQKAGNILTS
jgi:hypothetical protein